MKINCFYKYFLILIIIGSCNPTVKKMDGFALDIKEPIQVFYFLNTDCPICLKYQGTFKINNTIKGVCFYYVFCGNQNEETINEYINYDSIKTSSVILDKELKLFKKLKPTITPQTIILHNGNMVYSGKIDDRIVSLGAYKEKLTENYVFNTINLLLKNEPIKIHYTKPIGCFIEP